MNVCVIAEYYPRRRDPALGVWAHEQALAAARAGAEVRVLALERPVPPASTLRSPRALLAALRAIGRQPRRERRDGLDVEYVRFLAPPRESSYADWGRWARGPLDRVLTRLEREWTIDVVHAHYALPSGDAAQDWAARHRKPLVVSVHGGDVLGPLLARPEARARVAAVLRSSDLVLCNSRATLERTGRLTGTAASLRVVRLGARVPDAPPPKRPEPTLATLAHLIPRKRHEDVLRALADERLREVRWVVVGDGPERGRLERLAGDLGVAERVEWLGQLEHDAALRELARCHLMALPSVDEAFGVAYVEALAAGVPAIASRGEGGPEEIAAAGEGLLLVPPRNPDALAGRVADLLADPAELERLAAAASATAARHFTWERCGIETVAAYRDVLRP